MRLGRDKLCVKALETQRLYKELSVSRREQPEAIDGQYLSTELIQFFIDGIMLLRAQHILDHILLCLV
ncbi:hypothetical protein D3C80_1863300 [compost metagenome]